MKAKISLEIFPLAKPPDESIEVLGESVRQTGGGVRSTKFKLVKLFAGRAVANLPPMSLMTNFEK